MHCFTLLSATLPSWSSLHTCRNNEVFCSTNYCYPLIVFYKIFYLLLLSSLSSSILLCSFVCCIYTLFVTSTLLSLELFVYCASVDIGILQPLYNLFSLFFASFSLLFSSSASSMFFDGKFIVTFIDVSLLSTLSVSKLGNCFIDLCNGCNAGEHNATISPRYYKYFA